MINSKDLVNDSNVRGKKQEVLAVWRRNKDSHVSIQIVLRENLLTMESINLATNSVFCQSVLSFSDFTQQNFNDALQAIPENFENFTFCEIAEIVENSI